MKADAKGAFSRVTIEDGNAKKVTKVVLNDIRKFDKREIYHQVRFMYFLTKENIPGFLLPTEYNYENTGNSRVLTSIFPAGDPLDKHPNKVNVSKFLDESLKNLDSLHEKGHIHGDIKPSNMVLHNGNIYFIDYGSTNPKSITQNIEFPVFTTNLFYPNLHQRGINYRVPVSDSSTINAQPTGCRQLSWNEHKHSDKYALGLSALWIMHRQQTPNRDSNHSYKFISEFSCMPFNEQEKNIDDLTKSDTKLQRQLKHLILDPHFDDANLTQEAPVVANKEPVVSITNTPSKTTANEAELSQDTTVEAVSQDRTCVKNPGKAACVNFEAPLPKKQPDIKKYPKRVVTPVGLQFRPLIIPPYYGGIPLLYPRPAAIIRQEFGVMPVFFHPRPPQLHPNSLPPAFLPTPAKQQPNLGELGATKKHSKPTVISRLLNSFRILRLIK